MDPLSIIAGVAGIATAGTQISRTLFHLIRAARNAPQEIERIASEMLCLTDTLEHLHDILKTGQSYTRPSYLDAISHVIKNIQATQDEISNMVADTTILAKLRWVKKAAGFLSDIEKHKVTLTLQISILSTAILVKSNTEPSSSNERNDNRFRLQAESLVEAGQSSLQRDTSQHQISHPPRGRAPSPPVRTTKELPSPVLESEVPGHAHPDDLYGQSSTIEDNFSVSEEAVDGMNSALVRGSKVATSKGKEKELGESESHRTIAGFDPLSGGRVAQFGRKFHLKGDAATFLYKLVFLNEIPAHTTSTFSDGTTESGHSEDSTTSSGYIHEAWEEGEVGSPAKYVYRNFQEPGRVVNQLLLDWTSLSESEIASGNADSQTTTTSAPSRPSRSAYVESDDESEEEYRVFRQGENGTWRAEKKEKPSSTAAQAGKDTEIPNLDRLRQRFLRKSRQGHDEPRMPTHEPRTTRVEYEQPAVRNDSERFPDNPMYQQQRNCFRPIMRPRPRFLTPPPPPSTLPPQDAPPSPSPPDAPIWIPTKPKFQKPHVVVLPPVDMADSEIGSMTPELDVSSCLNMSIVRQNENIIWNLDEFVIKNRIPGKAIMGSLVGDKSARNPHGMDLAHTLIQGQNMKLVYIRGNGLGETWFMNEQPVFLQFFHCGYLPQFYPAKETDAAAMEKEYVSVGDEWASFEALSQLGLSVKGREEGRVLLDPSTTWSIVKELAMTTLQLSSMRQRRLFTSTFYNSISTFRQKHCGEVAKPLFLKSNSTTGPQPDLDLTSEKPDVLSFLVKDEDGSDETKVEKQETQRLRPQISITPPITPQDTSSPELDKSDVGSTESSRSRISRFMKRYTTGRRQSHLSPPLYHYNSKSSESSQLSEDDGKRPVTPTDSGIGSSVD
ncbi:uncharacterized protein B0J16DRAFT_411571 [Fusarium flagelliforme]|uniref:Fungal N-terminal domain-containing protein n=1 Tax=Fusarium flagelliforme TaxID=2675880 RepID=A0A395MCY5_9HYPO|nr:uncharacterized protein B0J16DRAFT_411571 [Fusarium flagelliforme]KAH7192927.1 hypothetical protein B0J16DRAFT_411571 [Fusarium flagelliforme]RFN45721.1 hypothetical protein FIE12Z_10033 [Fusarium flagelliforme]